MLSSVASIGLSPVVARPVVSANRRQRDAQFNVEPAATGSTSTEVHISAEGSALLAGESQATGKPAVYKPQATAQDAPSAANSTAPKTIVASDATGTPPAGAQGADGANAAGAPADAPAATTDAANPLDEPATTVDDPTYALADANQDGVVTPFEQMAYDASHLAQRHLNRPADPY